MSSEMSDKKPESQPATLEVGGEVPNANTPDATNVDLEDRDPNHMNDHVKIHFEDIIGEPDKEVFSFDQVWVISFKVFSTTKLWCYRILSLICAIPLAVIWGLHFGCLGFCNVWVCIPCLKSTNIKLFCVRRLYEICLGAFVAPCFEAMGKMCSGIRIRMAKD